MKVGGHEVRMGIKLRGEKLINVMPHEIFFLCDSGAGLRVRDKTEVRG